MNAKLFLIFTWINLRARIFCAFVKVMMVGRAGFELATFRLSVERSSRAELPAHVFWGDTINIMWVYKNCHKSFNATPLFVLSGLRRARSLARIKVSAFGAEDRGFKSLRARFLMVCIGLVSVCFWQKCLLFYTYIPAC